MTGAEEVTSACHLRKVAMWAIVAALGEKMRMNLTNMLDNIMVVVVELMSWIQIGVILILDWIL